MFVFLKLCKTHGSKTGQTNTLCVAQKFRIYLLSNLFQSSKQLWIACKWNQPTKRIWFTCRTLSISFPKWTFFVKLEQLPLLTLFWKINGDRIKVKEKCMQRVCSICLKKIKHLKWYHWVWIASIKLELKGSSTIYKPTVKLERKLSMRAFVSYSTPDH